MSSKSIRVSARVPVVLLGIPIEGVENPYLVAPGGQLRITMTYYECGSPALQVSGVPQEVSRRAAEFWRKLTDGLGVSACSTASVEGAEGLPVGGTYAALTASLLHLVARAHSDVLSEDEIVEMGRMSDPWEDAPWWQGAVDAMRYCAATGKSVAYRNDEEAVELSGSGVSAGVESVLAAGKGLSRAELGESLFDAVVNMMGQAVLEASDAIRSGSDPMAEALRRLRVQNAVAYLIYGVRPPEGCLVVPGLPGFLEVVCPRRG